MEAPAPSRHARLSAGRLNLSRHIINPPALARLRQSRGLARVSTTRLISVSDLLEEQPNTPSSLSFSIKRPFTSMSERLRSIFQAWSASKGPVLVQEHPIPATGTRDFWRVPIGLGLLEEHRSQSDRAMYFVSPIVAGLLEPKLTADERAFAVFEGANALFALWNSFEAVENWEQTAELRRLSLEAGLALPLELTTIRLVDRLVMDQAGAAKHLCEEALQINPSPRLFQRLSTIELVLGNGDLATDTLQTALELLPALEQDDRIESTRAELKLDLAGLMLFQGMVDSALSLFSEVSQIAE